MEGWKDLPDVLILDTFAHLSLVDKLNASLTCKRWREVLFHPHNWSQVTFDFSTNQLQRETFLINRVAHFISACSITTTDQRSNYAVAADGCSQVKHAQLMLGRLLHKLSFNYRLQELSFRICIDEKYQPLNVIPPVSTIQDLRDNAVQKLHEPLEEDSHNRSDVSYYQSYFTNSGIRRESLKKNDKHLDVVDYVEQICATANFLSHLSLGCIPNLLQERCGIINVLKKYQSHSVKSLHVSHHEIDQPYFPLDVSHMVCLKNLQYLSLDMCDVSDLLLISLMEGGRAKLRSLNITMLSHRKGIRRVHNRTWDLVNRSCPELELTLNIVHCLEAVQDLTTVINPSMPLTHLRIFFCDAIFVHGLHHVARFQSQTLQSFQIIESMCDGPLYYEIDLNEQDPFVMMAWRCTRLSSFSVVGIALQEHDVLAIARLRGRQLNKFEVLDDCITPYNAGDNNEFEEDFTMSYDSFCEEISSCLGQNWQPLSADDVHESIYDHEVNESSAFLPILLEDQKSKLYC